MGQCDLVVDEAAGNAKPQGAPTERQGDLVVDEAAGNDKPQGAPTGNDKPQPGVDERQGALSKHHPRAAAAPQQSGNGRGAEGSGEGAAEQSFMSRMWNDYKYH